MAETLTRLNPATLQLSTDLVYEDVWTDETKAQRARDAGFGYRYADLATPAPSSTQCQAGLAGGLSQRHPLRTAYPSLVEPGPRC